MADIYKSALLILNTERTEFLVVQKGHTTNQWLMPGGKVEEGETPEESLVREIQEEVGCEADVESFSFLATYEAPASGEPGKTVRIDLYAGSVEGEPRANSEIVALGWLRKESSKDPQASEMIRDHIIPDLVKRGVLV